MFNFLSKLKMLESQPTTIRIQNPMVAH